MTWNSNSSHITPVHLEQLIEFDEDGFLRDPDSWNESVARFIAAMDGIGELTSDQWKIIWSLRDEYHKHNALPVPRIICHINHLTKNCVSELFQNNRREVWRIAGLPNPGEEAKAYL